MVWFRVVFAFVFAAISTNALAQGSASPAGATPPSIARRLHLPRPSEVHLDNGLTVVLEEDHRAPFVSMRLSYRAGWSHDPRDKVGLAQLTMRMMTMATKHVPAGAYERWLDRVGATDRGWRTSTDSTSIWATLPASAVPLVLWLWSDQMGFFAAADPKLLADASGVLKNQHSQMVEDAPYGALTDIELQALYPDGHPYHAVFSPAAMDRITADDLREFHDRRFAPNTAVLVLSGDLRSAEVVEEIRKYFNAIPPAPAEPEPISRIGFEGNARIEAAANVNSAAVTMTWRTPAYLDNGDAELDVAARLLVGPRVSTLGYSLITERGVATSVTAEQYSRALDSFFEIRAIVAKGHTPDEVISAIDGVLARARGSMSDDSFRAAAESVLAPRVQDLDPSTRRAELYAQYVFLRNDADWIDNDLDRYEAATAADVRAALRHWLAPDHRVVVVVNPDAAAPRGGEVPAPRGRAP